VVIRATESEFVADSRSELSYQRLSLGQIVRFAGTFLPIYAIQIAITTQLPKYFTSDLGISLAVVGSSFALVRLIDIWLDPLLGMAIDRTRTRFGRHRLWLLAATPILMLALWMLFEVRVGVGRAYLIGWMLAMYLGFSAATLSIAAWGSSLAANYHDRSRLFGILVSCGVLGAALALTIPILTARHGLSDADGIRAMGGFIILMLPLTVTVTLWLTPDRPRDDASHQLKVRDIGRLLGRRNVLRVLLSDLCLSLGPGWMAALYLFFIKDSRGFTTAEANLLLIIYTLAGVAGGPAASCISRKVGKHRAVMVSAILYATGILTIMIVPRGAFALAALIMAVLGGLNAGLRGLLQAVTGDVADEARLEIGANQNALLYSLTTATSKLGGALSVFVTFNLLSKLGFDPRDGVSNTPAHIHALELVLIIGQVVLVLLGSVCFAGYKLTAARHDQIMAALEARRSALAPLQSGGEGLRIFGPEMRGAVPEDVGQNPGQLKVEGVPASEG
jgi:glycoside/pentoside/hexuronide:cation symporter, GPH family